MNTIHKQRVFCKKEDWNISLAWNIVAEGDALTLTFDTKTKGVFCLKALDSGENGFAWSRVSLDYHLPADSLIRTYAYASDVKNIGDNKDIDEFLAGLKGPTAKNELHKMFKLVGSSDDFYLYMTGRYLWFMFEFISAGIHPVLKGLRVHMAGDHMIDYLPEIYRKQNGFTKRFLSVFDSMYTDMEKAIFALPARFDFESTDPAMLRYLADWVCVDESDLDDTTLIERIRNAAYEYESRYTVRGIKNSVQRLTGREPLIIESMDVDPNRPGCVNSSLYRKLYGENPYKFFILLAEDSFHDHSRMESFLKKMRQLIPANTDFELVLLKRCVQLDWHTYLGINSAVSDYSAVMIDESTTIHYDTMIGGDQLEY